MDGIYSTADHDEKEQITQINILKLNYLTIFFFIKKHHFLFFNVSYFYIILVL